jgi:membrane-associated phospholipid phosphatase
VNRILAKALSIIFNPLLMPTFLLAVFYFFAPHIVDMAGISAMARLGFLSFVNVYTFLMPILLIYFMYSRKWVQTLTLKNLRERRLPYLATIIFYLFLSYFLYTRSSHYAPTAILVFFSAVVIIIVAVVSLWWQISAHAAAIGGSAGAFFITHFKYDEPNLYYASLIALIIAGAVMTARLKLNAHSLAQVIAGFAVGLGVSLAGYSLL